MKLSEQLRKEWALIDHPGKWCKGVSALNSKGRKVYEWSSAASRFCQSGARIRVGFENLGIQRCLKFDSAINLSFLLASDVAIFFKFDSVRELNDHPKTTHDDMRVFYEIMIYMAEQCE
jgi:hypothetical protein